MPDYINIGKTEAAIACFKIAVTSVFLAGFLSGCGLPSDTGAKFDIAAPAGKEETKPDNSDSIKRDSPAATEPTRQTPLQSNAPVPAQPANDSSVTPPVTAEISLNDGRRATFTASPNPIIDADSNGHGLTNLSWNCEGVGLVEVHLDRPDGKLFARTGPSYTAPTGRWVVDGMTFYLQDVTNNKPLTAANTLARLVVRVQR